MSKAPLSVLFVGNGHRWNAAVVFFATVWSVYLVFTVLFPVPEVPAAGQSLIVLRSWLVWNAFFGLSMW